MLYDFFPFRIFSFVFPEFRFLFKLRSRIIVEAIARCPLSVCLSVSSSVRRVSFPLVLPIGLSVSLFVDNHITTVCRKIWIKGFCHKTLPNCRTMRHIFVLGSRHFLWTVLMFCFFVLVFVFVYVIVFCFVFLSYLYHLCLSVRACVCIQL